MKQREILHIGARCTGCFACQNACPYDAISFNEHNEGFYYPSIDTNRCVNCGICDKICPRVASTERYTMKSAYYGWSNDVKTREQSSSGGLFAELAQLILADGGCVYGAAFNYANEIRLETHSTDEVPLLELLKSKYVQSYVGESFRKIKTQLKSGRKVLFCGTPCQLDGLRAYLGNDYKNLILVDFICHGVPSMDLLRKHLDMLKLTGIREINFRPKVSSWVDYFLIKHSKGERKIHWTLDEYFYSFEKNKSIRQACMNCEHCNGARSADITIADFWGIYKYAPEEYDPKGISLILCNTDKGTSFLYSLIQTNTITCRSLPLLYAEYVYERKRSKETGYDIDSRNRFITDVYTIGYLRALKKNGMYISKFQFIISMIVTYARKIYRKIFK